MKLITSLATVTAALLLAGRVFALPIPSDGSDGNFSPGADIEVDLSQAITGAWDANNSANTGKGRYDSSKWAIVFKYASVNIPAGVTVTFKNHPTHAPVVWLVNGNVNIAGTVSVAGKPVNTDPITGLAPVEPGPGGFRGGAFGPGGSGAGFGPGGGGAGGSGTYVTTYGNPQILPLIGGSGGGSSRYGETSYTGASGGGAILIASIGTIAISGAIDARGFGDGAFGASRSSGGAIKLIAEQVLGAGSLNATCASEPGRTGRIRIETSLLSTGLQINPSTIAVPPPAFPVIWPGTNAPTATVLSVDGVATPGDPSSPLISSADVGVQNNGNVNVIIQTTNFPTSGNVKLRVGPKYADAVFVNAIYSGGNFASANWVATLTFNPGFSALQAIATVP